MFSVIFEGQSQRRALRSHRSHGKMQELRPELRMVDGFVDNIRYRFEREGGAVAVGLRATRRPRGAGGSPTNHTKCRHRGRHRNPGRIITPGRQAHRDTEPPADTRLHEQRIDEDRGRPKAHRDADHGNFPHPKQVAG